MKARTHLAFWCRFGHEMTDDNTRLGRGGEPQCKECLRLHLAAVRRRGERKSVVHVDVC